MQIDKEFAAMIPPLLQEERRQLEENLVEYGGARDPLVVWDDGGDGILLDGHNRYEICTRLDLPYEIDKLTFDSRSHAEEWLILNQFGRRNLSAYVRTQLALRLEETIAARAKANQKKSGGAVPQKSAEPVETRKEVAKRASVSHDTVAKVKKINASEKAGKVDAETVAKLRTGEVSINRVVRDLKKQEAADKREEQKAVAVKKRKKVRAPAASGNSIVSITL